MCFCFTDFLVSFAAKFIIRYYIKIGVRTPTVFFCYLIKHFIKYLCIYETILEVFYFVYPVIIDLM